MRTTYLPLFLLLLSGPLFGQTKSITTTYTEEDLRDLASLNPASGAIRSIDNRYEGVKGTPFLGEDWQKGAFQLQGKEEFGQEILIKLDLVEQLLYFQLTNGFIGSLPSAKLQTFRLYTGKDQYRLFRIYPESEVEGTNNSQLKFYEVLYNGPFEFLKHHFKEFRKADYQGAYSANRRYDEYIDQNSLWLRETGKSFHKVRFNKKSIEQALPGQADNIQKVIKSEKLSLKQEEELIQLLNLLQNQW